LPEGFSLAGFSPVVCVFSSGFVIMPALSELAGFVIVPALSELAGLSEDVVPEGLTGAVVPPEPPELGASTGALGFA
jgi:hypothetical protein